MTTNQQRILDISKKLGLSHIGSNLSCLPIIEEIYAKKKSQDIVILDNAHAHLAHLLLLENKRSPKGWIEAMIEHIGIHCDRKAGCDSSGGSLGHGLGIGIGYALADPNRDVYVIVSDGSMMEGSNWEALRIIDDLQLKNLKIYTNFNGYTAVAKSRLYELTTRMKIYQCDITFRTTSNTKDFDGVQGHYKTI